MEHLPVAFEQFMTLEVFTAIIAGTIFGTFIGALPGMGSVVALVVALPFTFSMSVNAAIALVLCIYCSSVFGGSISAILINTPGTPQSAATVFDGYPMTQQGKADLALGWATVSSVVGGLFSLIILMLAAPQLAAFGVRFGQVETFALILFALTCIAWVSRGSTLKGLIAGAIGLFLATVGPDTMTGLSRFHFGIAELSGGFSLISVLVGFFAMSEVFSRAAIREEGQTEHLLSGVGFRVAPWPEWRTRLRTLIQSSVIGTFIGVLPGTGATVATFVSYAEAKRASRRRDQYGKGEPEGVIASEAANNAVTGGALVPTLALGIPGDGGTAVIMGALLIHGLVPGVQLFRNQPELIMGAFIILFFANILMFFAGLLGSQVFTRLLRLPEAILMAMVLLMSLVGAFAVRGNPADVIAAILAGVVGVLLRFNGVPMAPIVIGMALGKTFEESFRQGMMMNDGSFLAFFGHPIALGIFILTLLVVGWPIASRRIRGVRHDE